METNTGGEKLVEERSLLYDKRLFPSASIFDPNNFNRYHFNTNAKRKFADVIAYKLLNRYLPTLDNDFERVWGKCDYSADKGGFFDYSQLKNTDTCIFTGLEFYGSDSLSRNTYEAFGGYEAFNMCLSAMFEQDGNYFGTGETSKYRTGTRAWCYDMKKKLKSITLEYEPETFYFTRDSYETDESYNAAVDKLVDTICEINQLSNEHEIKSDYVQGLKSGVEYLYELSFTNDFLKNNLESMLLPIIESSGEFPVSIFMYASKDIYEYKNAYVLENVGERAGNTNRDMNTHPLPTHWHGGIVL